jgi:hypothetical protein
VENKKVRGAKTHVYDGITFKSGLEVEAYKAFTENGFNPEYEKHTYVLQDTKLFPTLHYAPFKDRKLHKDVWGLNKYKVISIKYTPDFEFIINDILVIVEVKGKANDRYPYQKKLFFKWLEDNRPNSAFFEIHNKKQLLQAIEIINQLKSKEENGKSFQQVQE